MARHGIRQFIDLGCGLPTTPATHETVQAIQPHARVVYVDNDEQVIIHARTWQPAAGPAPAAPGTGHRAHLGRRRPQTRRPAMTGSPVTLTSLTYHWGDAYILCYARDLWIALRRDNSHFLTAATLAGLEHAIENDYARKPVPRDYDPPPPGSGYAGFDTDEQD